MADITIRLATIDDIHVLVHHRQGMFADMGLGTVESRSRMEAAFPAWAIPKIQSGAFWTWLACAGQPVVAGIGIWRMDWPPGPTDNSVPRAYIYNVYTEPEYRRRGIARHLMEHTVADCQQRGIRTIGNLRPGTDDLDRPTFGTIA